MPVNAHPAEVHLQEHVGVKMYLVEDNQEKYRVRNSRWPRKDMGPRRKKNRDQSEYRAYELDVAHSVSKDREEDLFYIE